MRAGKIELCDRACGTYSPALRRNFGFQSGGLACLLLMMLASASFRVLAQTTQANAASAPAGLVSQAVLPLAFGNSEATPNNQAVAERDGKTPRLIGRRVHGCKHRPKSSCSDTIVILVVN